MSFSRIAIIESMNNY